MNVGDVVQLKSGGPKMTIDKIENKEDTETAYCFWFSNADVKYGQFDVRTLKLGE